MVTNTPAIADVYADLQAVLAKLQAIDAAKIESANLVPMVKAVQAIAAFTAAIDAQITERAINNKELIPGVVVRYAVKHRQWSDAEAASQLAREQFGDKAFSVPALLSPAQIEKLPNGAAFVDLASFKPEAGKKAVY